jgi:glutathione peroxidase
MKSVAIIVSAVLACVVAATSVADEKGEKKVGPALKFKMKGIDGKEVDLSQFQGKVVMYVNVASKCGLTPQYEGLQKLHDKYSKEGLVIVGVPANEFGAQEPGTDSEIEKFCTTNYGVKFPMLSKVVVKGEGTCPLYSFLTGKDAKFPGDITWNFEKFLVGRNGEVVSRFKPTVKPDDTKLVQSIEAELAKK